MKVDALYAQDGKVINFREGHLEVKENDQWTGTFHKVEEQNLIFDAVSSKKPMMFKFETDKGSYEGQAFVADIDSGKTENIVYIESVGNLTKQ